MKILLIVKNFDLGGTEINVCQLANGLSDLGHEVHLASKDGRQVERLNKEVTHHSFRFSELRFITNFCKLSALVKDNGIEIIHGNQRMAINLAALLGKRHMIPSVGTVHGRIKYDIRSRYIRNVLDHIIVVAPHIKKKMAGKTSLLEKTSVVFNSIPLPAKLEKKQCNDVTRLLCVSRIDKKHGHFLEQLITRVMPDLIKAGHNIELQVIGDGDQYENIRSLVSNLANSKVQECISLLGFQKHPIDFMRDASVVLGVGRVAIESLATNTPVISANALFLGGLVTMENYEEMKSNNFVARDAAEFSAEQLTVDLKEFLVNKNEVQKEHYQISEKARYDFSQEKMLKSVEEIYLNLLSRK